MEKTANRFPDLHASNREQLAQFNELNLRLRGLATSPGVEKLAEPWRSGMIDALSEARAYALAGITATEASAGAGSSA
jgi:hypothetical protein